MKKAACVVDRHRLLSVLGRMCVLLAAQLTGGELQ